MDQERDLSNFAFPENREAISECINKIMNTLSFRKLAGKTQVILSLSGPDIRTRLTHTIEVARIARDICSHPKLKLNADLAEAIALAHDIGHTPFGHVGERTLREIMCGCDTLGGKVADRDFNFDNSGFKHNLQSFRVLYNFEKITENNEHENIWPFILWGALAHSKMTWSKSYSGMENEILISSKHCNLVYVCPYHEKQECKRNIQQKKNKELGSKKEICKPWFCANLDIVKEEDNQEIVADDLQPGETKKDYLRKEYIKKKYQKKIYCSRKCYLAKLWSYRIEKQPISTDHPYLFDHPFPNSFYSKSLDDYLFKTNNSQNWKDYISVEAIVVSQADEIAQRQQDLEDGINKNLLSFEEARDQVEEMIDKFKNEDGIKRICDEIKNKKKSDELGKLLVEFYIKLIVNSTLRNVNKFRDLSEKQEKINVFSMLDILYSMHNDSKIKLDWIKKELESIEDHSFSENYLNDSFLSEQFEFNYNSAYLYLMVYDYLEVFTKSKEFTKKPADQNEHLAKVIAIMDECIKALDFEISTGNLKSNLGKEGIPFEFCKLKEGLNRLIKVNKTSIDIFEIAYDFLKILDQLRGFLKNSYKDEYKDFFEKKEKEWCKRIGDLSLQDFFVMNLIYNNHFSEKNGLFCVKDLKRISSDIDGNNNAKDKFRNWKKILKHDANKVISNLVEFIFVDDQDWETKKGALETFEEKQRDTILKSESVEKNDGKAGYILTRLFKAYIANSHQLPDTGLKNIVITLQDMDIRDNLLKSEEKTFQQRILRDLKKTMVDNDETEKKIKEIETYFLNFFNNFRDRGFKEYREFKEDRGFKGLGKGASTEINAALYNRLKLYIFLLRLETEKTLIQQSLNSEEDFDRKKLKGILRQFRSILDNPCLSPTPFWKRILTRGICDYIASLTDQEAINEYEKLYAGIMELV